MSSDLEIGQAAADKALKEFRQLLDKGGAGQAFAAKKLKALLNAQEREHVFDFTDKSFHASPYKPANKIQLEALKILLRVQGIEGAQRLEHDVSGDLGALLDEARARVQARQTAIADIPETNNSTLQIVPGGKDSKAG